MSGSLDDPAPGLAERTPTPVCEHLAMPAQDGDRVLRPRSLSTAVRDRQPELGDTGNGDSSAAAVVDNGHGADQGVRRADPVGGGRWTVLREPCRPHALCPSRSRTRRHRTGWSVVTGAGYFTRREIAEVYRLNQRARREIAAAQLEMLALVHPQRPEEHARRGVGLGPTTDRSWGPATTRMTAAPRKATESRCRASLMGFPPEDEIIGL